MSTLLLTIFTLLFNLSILSQNQPLSTQTQEEKAKVAKILFDEGSDLSKVYLAESYKKAKISFLKAAKIYGEIGNQEQQAITLLEGGIQANKLGERTEAIKYFLNALLIVHKLNNQSLEAKTLLNIGKTQNLLGERQKALESFEQSLKLFESIENKTGKSENLIGFGKIYFGYSNFKKASDYFKEALLISLEINDKVLEGAALNNLGEVVRLMGDRQQSLQYFEKALKLFQTIGDKHGEAEALTGFGDAYFDLAENEKAFAYFTKSLQIYQIIGDKAGEAITFNNLGAVYDALFEKQKALEAFKQSFSLIQTVGDKPDIARISSHLGNVYYSVGNRKKAFECFSKALILQKQIGDKFRIAETLHNLGRFYEEAGEMKKSIDLFEQSRKLRSEIGDIRGESVTLSKLSRVYNSVGEKQKGLKYIYQALPNTLNYGVIYGYLMKNFIELKNYRLATFFGKEAISEFQKLRLTINGLDKATKKNYLNSVEHHYTLLAETLIKQNRLIEAQQVLNSFKHQQYFDFEKEQNIKKISKTLRETEYESRFEKIILLIKNNKNNISELKRNLGENQITKDNKQFKVLDLEFENLQSEYNKLIKQVETEFSMSPSEKDEVSQSDDLKEIQTGLKNKYNQTGEKTVVIYTVVGEDQFSSLLITSDEITSTSYTIKDNELNQKILQLWKLLQFPQFDPRSISLELYKIIFAQIATKLDKNTKTILWSLDRNLRYIPMAALFDGKQYLVEKFQNVNFTRLNQESFNIVSPNKWKGIGFGNTKEKKTTIGGKTYYFSSLPSVKFELGRIFSNTSEPSVFSGEVFLDEAFTKVSLLKELENRPQLVHIATHFSFEAGDEEQSFLLLGNGEGMTMNEMKRNSNLFAGVELLTLSACQTAAQQPNANGREIDAFAELAQRLGAKSVLASLWDLSDISTPELILRFYQEYQNNENPDLKLSKAEALRRSQLAMLKGEYQEQIARKQPLIRGSNILSSIKIEKSKLKLFQTNKQTPFAHPFYWSPFIIIGNWQ